MLMRVLPEPEPEPPQRQWRPRRATTENVPMMAGIAVAIPLVIAFIVVTFYLQRGDSDRRNAIVSQARAAVEDARQADGADVREKWESALQVVEDALLTLSDDAELRSFRAEARDMLDSLESAVRPELVLLADYGPGVGRRLAASRMQVYVLDTVQTQVMRHMLDQSRVRLAEEQPALVAYQGQTVGDTEIGALRDIFWLSAGDAWTSDALIILTDDDRLLQHNLSWGISRLPFDPYVEQERVFILRPYAGKLYNLDPGRNQIWRYRYTGEGFGEGEGYFSASNPDLSHAIDMTIDGAIYVLLDDGTLLKFLGAERQLFEFSGLPQPFDDPVAIVSEGDTVSGALYIADAGDGSIVALDKNGQFLHQIKAEGGALVGIEALTIEQDSRTLYVLVNGRLYAMGLPVLPVNAEPSQ
jgi:hypothetical protein